MHPFTPRWPDGDVDYQPPSPWTRTYHSADDLVAWAEHDRLMLHRTYPEAWHLDADGEWRCYSKGSSFEGLVEYAQHPEDLLACRLTVLDDACPNHWVIIEPRQREWTWRPTEVTEADAAAFTQLRTGLAVFGVWLLDVIVVSDVGPRWWSLNELTTGSTAWEFPATQPSSPVRRTRRHRRKAA